MTSEIPSVQPPAPKPAPRKRTQKEIDEEIERKWLEEAMLKAQRQERTKDDTIKWIGIILVIMYIIQTVTGWPLTFKEGSGMDLLRDLISAPKKLMEPMPPAEPTDAMPPP